MVVIMISAMVIQVEYVVVLDIMLLEVFLLCAVWFPIPITASAISGGVRATR